MITKVVAPLRGNPEQVRVIGLVFFMFIYKNYKKIKIMETILDYCIDNPFLVENLLVDVSYPDLCDRVYDLTEGRGLRVWLEEEATPANFKILERLVTAIERIMARKCQTTNNIIHFPPCDRMVA